MKVVLRSGADELVAFGIVDAGDGYDGTPILEHAGRYFTGSGAVTPAGYRVYIERRVRSVVTDLRCSTCAAALSGAWIVSAGEPFCGLNCEKARAAKP